MGIRDGDSSDPGSGMEKSRIRDKHPGSATLANTKGSMAIIDQLGNIYKIDCCNGSVVDPDPSIIKQKYL
jgi:hypothetical protein